MCERKIKVTTECPDCGEITKNEAGVAVVVVTISEHDTLLNTHKISQDIPEEVILAKAAGACNEVLFRLLMSEYTGEDGKGEDGKGEDGKGEEEKR